MLMWDARPLSMGIQCFVLRLVCILADMVFKNPRLSCRSAPAKALVPLGSRPYVVQLTYFAWIPSCVSSGCTAVQFMTFSTVFWGGHGSMICISTFQLIHQGFATCMVFIKWRVRKASREFACLHNIMLLKTSYCGAF